MNIKVEHTTLSSTEVEILNTYIATIPYINYVSKDQWAHFRYLYKIKADGKFAGVCALIPLNDWYKIGPIVILPQYQGKSLGKKLLSFVINANADKKMFLISANPSLWSIMNNLSFTSSRSSTIIPLKTRLSFLKYYISTMEYRHTAEFIKKQFLNKKHSYRYFVSKNSYLK